jgi:hypothetical protein
LGTEDRDPRSPGTGDENRGSPGTRDRGPESLGMGDKDLGAWILGQGRRGPGMFELFYLLDKIKLDMIIVVSFHENRLKV